ncbi:EAL domain-containing protein [Rhodoferax bucti]|uniref:EAL domain-containing protein n=1 Tax=Rhodoferax bucti TaxID=2576305 RepID=UPI0011080190|nr:EAL domain-containing protein [Rhodoferax bucti]
MTSPKPPSPPPTATPRWDEARFDDDDASLWKLALEGSGAGAWDWNIETGVQMHSRRWLEMLGYQHGEVAAHNQTFVERIHPDDLERVKETYNAYIEGRSPTYSTEFRLRCKNGSWKWILTSGMVVRRDAEGRPLRMIGTHVDIDQRKQAEAQLHTSEERWKLALESTGDGVWDWHIQDQREYFSKRLVEMYGYTEEDLQQHPDTLDSRTHPEDVAQMFNDRQAHFDGQTPTYYNEHRVRCKDGSWKWIMTRGMVVSRDADGRPLRMLGTHTDITARKEAEAQIRQHAYFDPLTGLPNRRMLRDRIEQEIKRNRRDGKKLAVLFMDLDHFKEVNDTLGHDNGDALLVEAARRLRGCVREHDTVARMGGDEFTLLITELDAGDRLEPLLQKLLQTMAAPFELGRERMFVSASIGVTLCPDDGSEVESLYKNADQALYDAKNAGRNRFSYFTPALHEAAMQRARIANDLHDALERRQLELHYQPIVELATGHVRKAEALLRWRHPVRGMISPAEFIPVAESSELIVDIGDWVFDQVASQLQVWRRSLHPHFQISINSSPVQFRRPCSGERSWVQRLHRMGLPGAAMVVEITEGLMLDADEAVTRQLLEWRDAGIQVALDDFGTGYSSLAYLQKLDIDFIKIDKSFVHGLAPHSTHFILCKAMVVMAHAMGLRVVAEGVETAQQRDLLLEVGCDFAQGYLFSKPLPPHELEALLSTPGTDERWLPQTTLAGMQLLVIDDHPIVRKGMVAALQQMQPAVDVLEASDGAQGLELLENHVRIKAVLIDLEMHPLGGIPTIRQIRQMQPALPVLVVAGSEDPADYEAAVAAGANGYCPKSAGLRTMRQALRQVLDGAPYVPDFIRHPPVQTGPGPL